MKRAAQHLDSRFESGGIIMEELMGCYVISWVVEGLVGSLLC